MAIERLFVATVLLTYAVHSSLACLLALAFARLLEHPRYRERLWKMALLAPMATTGAALAVASHRSAIDLAGIARTLSMHALPGRQVLMHIVVLPTGRSELRRIVDPVAAGLDVGTLVIAALCVGLALHRFARRRRVFKQALSRRAPIAVLARRVHGRSLTLSLAADIPSPVAFGRDEICLPALVANEFRPSQRDALIAHEAAHLERRDPGWFTAVDLIVACSAFQPLVFPVRRAFRRDAEMICDEAAVHRTGNAHALLSGLAALADPFDARSPLAAATSAYDGSPLFERAERIASLAAAPRRVPLRAVCVTAAALAALIVALLAAPTVSSAPTMGMTDSPLWAAAMPRGGEVRQRMLFVRSIHAGRQRWVTVRTY